MSASAGRVLIIPRGDYDSSVTYNMLDMVYYGGKSYICKQTSTGNDPTNTVYWQIMLNGASSLNDLTDVDITNPQNGDSLAYNSTAQKWENISPIGIYVQTPPVKTDYAQGDILDLTGIVVIAEYSNGLTRIVTGSCIFNPANGATLTPANTSVSISWESFSTTQPITVSYPTYGAYWDGSSSPTLTRTDLAMDFVDPVPYYSGMTGTPSSPFDDIYPWSEMVTEERTGGTMVKIPKFWYKITQNGTDLHFQISTGANPGFHVSPAHMDRGDGQGERDYIYVGRYHSNATNYKSQTGVQPANNTYSSTMKTNVHNLGSTIWGLDYATRFTIWLLYIVEFADFDSQGKIGGGNGNGSIANMGYTDSMPYHTGTTWVNKTIRLGTQYRNIEGLWDLVQDVLCGTVVDSNGLRIIIKPSDFSDSTKGINVGTPISGYASKFALVNPSGLFPLFIGVDEHRGSDNTYLTDTQSLDYSNTYELRAGGTFSASYMNKGIFCYDYGYFGEDDGSSIGIRIMELPDNS